MSGTFSTALQAILTSVRTYLLATPTGWPTGAREYVVPGVLAWDECECGLLAIEWQAAPYVAAFPTPAIKIADGCKPLLSLQIQVTALRCAPSPGINGEPPEVAAMAAAAETNLDDLEAVLRGTSQAVATLEDAGTILAYGLDAPKPAGPAGGCVGVTQVVYLGFRNVWGPC